MSPPPTPSSLHTHKRPSFSLPIARSNSVSPCPSLTHEFQSRASSDALLLLAERGKDTSSMVSLGIPKSVNRHWIVRSIQQHVTFLGNLARVIAVPDSVLTGVFRAFTALAALFTLILCTLSVASYAQQNLKFFPRLFDFSVLPDGSIHFDHKIVNVTLYTSDNHHLKYDIDSTLSTRIIDNYIENNNHHIRSCDISGNNSIDQSKSCVETVFNDIKLEATAYSIDHSMSFQNDETKFDTMNITYNKSNSTILDYDESNYDCQSRNKINNLSNSCQNKNVKYPLNETSFLPKKKPHYAACSWDWHGMTLLDFSILSELAYYDEEKSKNILHGIKKEGIEILNNVESINQIEKVSLQQLIDILYPEAKFIVRSQELTTKISAGSSSRGPLYLEISRLTSFLLNYLFHTLLSI